MNAQNSSANSSSLTSNRTMNQPHEQGSSEENSFDVSIVQLMCFPIIIALGLIGNSLICYAVSKRTRLRIIDYFILNLAVTDLATCIISIPFDFVEVLARQWTFGAFLCKIVYPLQTILISVSVCTLLCMSLERRRAIIRPFKPRIKGLRVLALIGFLWIFSVFLISPYIAILDVVSKDGSHSCKEHWPEDSHAKAFTLSVFVVLYLLPLFVIAANYIAISRKLWKDIQRVRKAIGEVSGQGKKQHIKARAHRNMRIVKIFILVVIAFGVCMAPNHIMWIWHDYGEGSQYEHFYTVLVFCNILMYSNSAINPFIFVFLHTRYCKDLINCCHCPFRKFWPARPNPKRHLHKIKKRTQFQQRKTVRRKNDTTKLERNFDIPYSKRYNWNNRDLLKAEYLYGEFRANGESRKAWKNFRRMELKDPNEVVLENSFRKRKPKVNFGGERIIHIDEDNNVEMESVM